jgi:alpha-L-fucosidase
MAWWREARFGLFLHWGLYSIPAGEWNGETGHGEWIRESARIPVETYEGLLSRFDPVKFDAGEWARTAKAAGMRYVVITSKHHDGFCLFDSVHTDWDVASTPFRRDVLKELSEACRSEGLRFCTYHSIMDWHHADYLPRRSWENRPSEGADFDRFERYLHAQVREIVERYDPAVMWFDGEWESTWTHARGERLFELCRSLRPSLIVNNRVDVHRGGMAGFSASEEALGDFATPEQEIPSSGVPGVDWETCMTMNDHWGWNARDGNWKSAGDLLVKLVDVASKGGNFLLNVGPKPDGTFPEPCLERLRAIGAWMGVNGEAIHGTGASPFDALPWGRCTVKPDERTSRLYLHVFDWPADGALVLPGIGNEPRRAFLLAKSSLLSVQRSGSDLRIVLPPTPPDPVCSVVVLEVEGKPIVYRAPEIRAASEIFVRPLEVAISRPSDALEVRYTTDGMDPGETSPIYRGPILLSDTTTLKARTFRRGRPTSGVAGATFTRVEPHPPVEVAGLSPGIRCERFRGDWDRLPDFDRLPPEHVETLPAVGLPGGKGEERLGLRFAGFVEAPRDEVYLFSLASDDGARLWVEGNLVVDNDGLHGTVEKRGAIALAKGPHAIRVEWFNKTGDTHLALRFAEVGGEPREVPVRTIR